MNNGKFTKVYSLSYDHNAIFLKLDLIVALKTMVGS